MASSAFHEAAEDLTQETREMHRALVSLIEELEAVDWYAQRVDATQDEELRRVLAHNRDEEKEHASMTLEWIRRRDPKFDELLRRFLFIDGPIIHAGAEEESAPASGAAGATARTRPRASSGGEGLGIGSLRSAGQTREETE